MCAQILKDMMNHIQLFHERKVKIFCQRKTVNVFNLIATPKLAKLFKKYNITNAALPENIKCPLLKVVS